MLAAARSAIGRLMRRPARLDGERRFDGAAGGRRLSGVGTFGAVNPEVGAAASMVRSRARYLTRNNQWLANAAANWTAALVGSGIRPTSASAEAVAAFDLWALDADADGRTDFWGIQAVIARALVEDGESFVLLRAEDDGFRALVIPAEQVDESATRDLDGGGHVVQGVEFDASGRRVAYHVLPHRPTAAFASYAPPNRVDAADVLHIMAPIAPGQVRGVSWLAPIILPANELDQLTDALLVGAKVAAMHAAFLVDQNGSGAPFDGEDLSEVSLEPGTVRRLPTGFDIRFNTPQQAQQGSEFIKHSLRGLAAGLGLPSHMLDGDLSGANYSSLRAGLIPFRARVEQVQFSVLVPQLLRPVWARVQLLSDVPEAAAEWLPPAWQQVDPAKALEADVAEIGAGLASRRQKVAERGWSVAELDAEIAADREREAALGLSFGTSAPEPKPEDQNA
ncbi:phage portal protein [Methylopila sp. M107]|uniref:phage portal protein n=1 Tax=Methylopila sp. M107 TaxID=1101190 RepID=UPI00039F94F6|nr:phage portal protein [Methylopila sp. M107]